MNGKGIRRPEAPTRGRSDRDDGKHRTIRALAWTLQGQLWGSKSRGQRLAHHGRFGYKEIVATMEDWKPLRADDAGDHA